MTMSSMSSPLRMPLAIGLSGSGHDNNSNSLRNNSDSNQENHSTNETSSALTAPNNRTPNNNHESEFVAKEDIIKNHQKCRI